MKFSIIALASFVGAVAATQCSRNEFSWSSPKTGECCLSNGGNPKPPSVPEGKECPNEWNWHSEFECCVPKTPSQPSQPSCPSGPWDHQNQCCNKPAPPPPPPSKPQPPPSKPNQCARGQFNWNAPKTGNCCLPSGGNPSPPQCPGDKECPGGWEWHGNYECCVPKNPGQPTQPSCPSGPWDHDNQCCHKPSPPTPPPQPSHKPYRRDATNHSKRSTVAARNWRSKTVSCPAGQTICNVSDGLSKSNTYACVDTKRDVNFCGGCGTASDEGQDCSAIPNSWNTACDSGRCTVLTCESGFYVGRDGKSCRAL